MEMVAERGFAFVAMVGRGIKAIGRLLWSLDWRTPSERKRHMAYKKQLIAAEVYKKAYERDEEYIEKLEAKIKDFISAQEEMTKQLTDTEKQLKIYRKAAYALDKMFHEERIKYRSEKLLRGSFEAMWEERCGCDSEV